MNVRCIAYIPVRLPFPREEIDWLTNGSIRQLLKLSGVRLNPNRSFPISITRASKVELMHLKMHFPKDRFRPFILLRLSGDIPFLEADWKTDSADDSPALYRNFFDSILSGEFGYLSHQLVLAANIARPGSIHTETGAMFFDGQFDRSIPGLKSSLELLFSFRSKPVWPRIEMLKLEKVWKWLCESGDFHSGFGSTPLGRALAAFSYMFCHDYSRESPLDNLHTIIALEAIYGSNGSQRELVERSRLFLGDPPQGKALIHDLYKARSALVHGGMNLPFFFGDNDGLPEVEKFREREMEFWDYSLPLLIATFQRMAKEHLSTVEFEVRLRKRKRQPKPSKIT